MRFLATRENDSTPLSCLEVGEEPSEHQVVIAWLHPQFCGGNSFRKGIQVQCR